MMTTMMSSMVVMMMGADVRKKLLNRNRYGEHLVALFFRPSGTDRHHRVRTKPIIGTSCQSSVVVVVVVAVRVAAWVLL